MFDCVQVWHLACPVSELEIVVRDRSVNAKIGLIGCLAEGHVVQVRLEGCEAGLGDAESWKQLIDAMSQRVRHILWRCLLLIYKYRKAE